MSPPGRIHQTPVGERKVEALHKEGGGGEHTCGSAGGAPIVVRVSGTHTLRGGGVEPEGAILGQFHNAGNADSEAGPVRAGAARNTSAASTTTAKLATGEGHARGNKCEGKTMGGGGGHYHTALRSDAGAGGRGGLNVKGPSTRRTCNLPHPEVTASASIKARLLSLLPSGEVLQEHVPLQLHPPPPPTLYPYPCPPAPPPNPILVEGATARGTQGKRRPRSSSDHSSIMIPLP